MSTVVIDSISVVYFHNMPGAKEFSEDGGFNSISYGDAAYTLVSASDLVSEVIDRKSDGLLDPEVKEQLTLLIEALLAVPIGVYVALDG